MVTLEGTREVAAPFFTTTGTAVLGSLNPLAIVQVSVLVDDVNLNLTFDSIRVDVPQTTVSKTTAITVGLGQTVPVTTTVTFNPFTIIYDGTQAQALTAGAGGLFSIASATSLDWLPFSLSGSYTVTGPTEGFSGTFQTPVISPSGGLGLTGWGTFNSNGYPDTAALQSSRFGPSSPRWVNFGDIVDNTVNGAHVTAGVSQLSLSGLGGLNGTIALTKAVPEPSAICLLIAGVSIVGSRRKRR